MTQPPLALTLGDPSGVGPEVTITAWRTLGTDVPFVAIGDAVTLEAKSGPMNVPVRRVDDLSQWRPDTLCVLDIPAAALPKPGNAQPANAASIIQSIKMAVELAQQGKAIGVVTNPINKAVLQYGGDFHHPGHTEFLAELDGKTRSVMMLCAPELRVVPVTIHEAIKDVPQLLTASLLEQTIRITDAALRTDFAISAPILAVAGLNPHAGEGGLMGTEDDDLIAPVIAKLQAEGLNIHGPRSADTMFHAQARQAYDCAICMYHDQALIPIKTIDFDNGVNTTLGLSFIRTSPDHGTAFDIAGKGVAKADSLIASIKLAHQLATNRVAT